MIGPDGYPTVLDQMVQNVHVRGPVGELLRRLNIGDEAEYDGPGSMIGVAKKLAEPAYGSCEVVDIKGRNVLVVHDAFAVTLTEAGITPDAAWYAAAVFAGLQEAIETRAGIGLPQTKRVVEAAAQLPSIGEKYWHPDTHKTRAVDRLAAGLTLEHLGLAPDSLDLPYPPPYPNHIAAFIDPVILTA